MSQQDNNWYKLDNAAKFFPSVSSRSDTKVFRFACELKEPIDGKLLQQALMLNIEDFPIYRSVLRRGIFWYYMDPSEIVPQVAEENLPLCFTIYTRRHKSLMFRVSYYKQRINLEVFHALADGTGALDFLKGLIHQYLMLKHPELINNPDAFIENKASVSDKMFDDFQKHYTPSHTNKSVNSKKAYRLKGLTYTDYRIRAIEGTVSVKKSLDIAHQYDVTLTILMVSVLFSAIGQNMGAINKRKDVVAAVPVNLRKYFPSESSRNFFTMVNIGYNFNTHSDNLEDIISHVADSFANNITEPLLRNKLNSLVKLEKNPFFRIVPLNIKDIVLKIANNIVSRNYTCGVSSIGAINMPNVLKPYIESFDILNSTNKLQLFICSYDDKLKLSFSSPYINSNIQKDFFRTLVALGIPVEISATPLEEV